MALGDPELVDAVVRDWTTAPVSDRLRATLAFVRKQARAPETLTSADAEAVLAAGVSREALLDAVYICAGFSILTRIADAFGAVPVSELLPPELREEYTASFLARGYA